MEPHFDVLVVGGGPAGSTCARFLTRGGARVALIDREQFPRVKLCGGWVSAPIWDELALTPGEYAGRLWEWRNCHVRYGRADHAVACRGFFIRRFELDDFLLRRSGAALHLGLSVQEIGRDADGLWSVAGLRARHLVGAAGTHCPVARLHAPARPMGPVAAQEHEFQADPSAIARTRIGQDGEPELLLHDDLGGYSWNVPKTDWLNVGSGTADPSQVRAAWREARGYFREAGHVPPEAFNDMESKAMKGHAYYLFDPIHLDAAARVDADGRGGSYLAGDSLGLAQPLTAEGILPAVISGRLAAEAILAGAPASYPERLRRHPIMQDYRRIHGLTRTLVSLGGSTTRRPPPLARAALARLSRRAVSTGFAWMFSGARLPAPRLWDLALAAAGHWNGLRGTGARGTGSRGNGARENGARENGARESGGGPRSSAGGAP
ncbi:MAG TPA: FAD-dependent oxidoreductase [Polyangia bacterium]|nr:FAD-dependent oxidoreductase [Polyangia bacterium]